MGTTYEEDNAILLNIKPDIEFRKQFAVFF